MATQIDLGAVVPIGKGDWNIGTTYERANIVRHNSVAWICKVESSTGVEPIEDSSDWYLLVKDTSSVTSINGQKGDVNLDIISPSQVDNKIYTEINNVKSEINSKIPSMMVGASSEIDGKEGLVPKPDAGSENKYLKGDGTWGKISIPPSLFKGVIISYSGQFQDKNPKVDNVIYTDWAICDGTNGTPNLIDKFIRGTNTNGIGTTGGSDSKDISIPMTGTVSGLSVGATTLTIAQMPSHNHSTNIYPSNGNFDYSEVSRDTSERWPINTSSTGGSQSHTHSISGTGTISGTSSATVNTIPAYYALAYIMKIK